MTNWRRTRRWSSWHDGAAAFARGVYAGIRNPIAHEAGDELEENE
ncbi:TIGR02391 family protein, partial [Streptomyces griseus]